MEFFFVLSKGPTLSSFNIRNVLSNGNDNGVFQSFWQPCFFTHPLLPYAPSELVRVFGSKVNKSCLHHHPAPVDGDTAREGKCKSCCPLLQKKQDEGKLYT